MPRKRRRRSVPGVLWRLFQDRARPLLDVLASSLLLPVTAPVEICRWCRGNLCLGCVVSRGQEEAKSFLLRPEDPVEYRKLMTQCFVVVHVKDPLPLAQFSPLALCSQRQVVMKTIETLVAERPRTDNVLCNDYRVNDKWSASFDILSTPAWCLLLERIGASLMSYLLKGASIFLPFSGKKHYQVAGPPASISKHFLSKRKQTDQFSDAGVQSGVQKKMKISGDVDFLAARFEPDNFFHGSNCITCINSADGSSISKVSQVDTTNQGAAPSITNHSSLTTPDSEVVQRKDANPVRENLGEQPVTPKRHRKRKRRRINNGSACPSKMLLVDEGCSSERYQKPVLCPCCSVLKVARRLPNETQIQRSRMFYNAESCSAVFLRKHQLSSLKPNASSSMLLIKEIFGFPSLDLSPDLGTCAHYNGSCPVGVVCMYHSLNKLLKSLIKRTRSCQYLRLLNKHCILPPSVESHLGNAGSTCKGPLDDSADPSRRIRRGSKQLKNDVKSVDLEMEKVQLCSSKNEVVSFIWAVCRNIVPKELIGSCRNWRILRRNMYKFIQLRRFENFSLKQCMHKLKLNEFPFLLSLDIAPVYKNQLQLQSIGMHGDIKKNCIADGISQQISDMRHVLLERWIYWFFSYLVESLVEAHFYVTESEHRRQDVVYYRKSIWKTLCHGEVGSKMDQGLTCLSDSDLRNILNGRSFGFSKLRFFPKKNGLRMVTNLKASSCLPAQTSDLHGQSYGNMRNCFPEKLAVLRRFKSVNSVFQDAHAVLKNVQHREPEKLGSSVFDYHDIYRRLRPFLVDLKNGTEMPEIHLIVADVKKAFDSIGQDKLLHVMNEVISQPGYYLEKLRKINCRGKLLWVQDKIFSAEKSKVSTATALVSGDQLSHGVFIKQGRGRIISRDELFFKLNELVKRNVVRFDRSFYLQVVGIPQGSVLSTLLCSFYFGHLERNLIFPFLEKAQVSTTSGLPVDENCQHSSHSDILDISEHDNEPGLKYILLRFVDDFLFISTSKSQATRFFSRLKRGFRDYNCFMKEEKFRLSFDTGCTTRTPSSTVHIGDSEFIQWSGMLINCRSLDIQADYTRYLTNHLRSSLCIHWEGTPSSNLKEKLCAYLRPKCFPIFLDPQINSESVVRLNIYQNFLICAMKFHCYIRELSYICKIPVVCQLKMIENSFRYLLVLMKRMRFADNHSLSKLFPDLKREVEWLGLVAYIQALERKQTRHRELLSLLKAKFFKHRISGEVSSVLAYAVDRSNSSVLWRIRY